MFSLFIGIGLVVFALITFFKTIVIVPQKQAYIVERLGKYSKTLEAGFHILVPFIDRVAYQHSLKEVAVDVPSQTCITSDNIGLEVDGIIYLQVVDAVKASYGINNYRFAATQLAQTNMRSAIGMLEMDKTFQERESINATIIEAVDEASDPWGVKVTRYEIKNLTPPGSIKEAMESQAKAEREKRAMIAESEGQKQAKINRAEGIRKEMESISEGEKIKRTNEAEGKAAEITKVAEATASGISKVAEAIRAEGGSDAVQLRVAESYIKEFGKLAKESNTMIIPGNVTDIAAMAGVAKKVFNNPGIVAG